MVEIGATGVATMLWQRSHCQKLPLICREHHVILQTLYSKGLSIRISAADIRSREDLDRIVADFTVTEDATLLCTARSSSQGKDATCEIHDLGLGLKIELTDRQRREYELCRFFFPHGHSGHAYEES